MAKKHKWKGTDECVNCGLKRKAKALTPNLRSFGEGNFMYDYLINKDWGRGCPPCIDDTMICLTFSGILNEAHAKCTTCGKEEWEHEI